MGEKKDRSVKGKTDGEARTKDLGDSAKLHLGGNGKGDLSYNSDY